MRIRSARSRTTTKSKPRKRDDLLAIWLDLLKDFDNAPRRRAAKLRLTQRPRRQVGTRSAPWSGHSAPLSPDELQLASV
jgi:hypothetical protein